jgi:hypothetical protein
MLVTELTCPHCHTKVQGAFELPALFRLTPEQLHFVEVFLRCRGHIKEVERELQISYPTVRSRLDQIIQALGYPAVQTTEQRSARDVLDALGNGELTFEEALQLLKGEGMK